MGALRQFAFIAELLFLGNIEQAGEGLFNIEHSAVRSPFHSAFTKCGGQTLAFDKTPLPA